MNKELFDCLTALGIERSDLAASRKNEQRLLTALQQIADTVEESPHGDSYEAAVLTGETMRQIAEAALDPSQQENAPPT